MRRGFWLALLLLGAGGAQAAAVWTLEPALQGWTREGRETELRLRVRADAALKAHFELRAGALRFELPLQLQAGQTQRLLLRVPAAAQTLQASMDGVAQAPPTLRLAERPLRVLVSEQGGEAALADEATQSPAPLRLQAADLPHQPAAYEALDALAIDAALVARLEPTQLAALRAHAAACGRLALLGAAGAGDEVTGLEPGCAGQGLVRAATWADALVQWQQRQAADPTPEPPAAPTGLRAWSWTALALAAFGLGCVLVLWLAPARARLPGFIGLSMLGSAAALALPRWLPQAAQLQVWSEAESGDRWARYEARWRWSGQGGGSREMGLPGALAGGWRRCHPAQALRLEWDGTLGQPRQVQVDDPLFAAQQLCFRGVFPVQRQPRPIRDAEGQLLALRNGAPGAWPAGWWLDEAGVRRLPALTPGGSVQPGPSAELPAALQSLARSRLPLDGGAALWNLELGAVSERPVDAQAWLLVRAP